MAVPGCPDAGRKETGYRALDKASSMG